MITEQQRLARADKLGSSDAAAVMGLDPFRSAYDTWLEKTGQAEGFAGNEHTERGNLLEPVLVKYAEQQIGKTFSLNHMFTHPNRMLIANLDALFKDEIDHRPLEIVECKTSNNPDEYGEEGTDEVPDRTLIQIAHQFVCVPTARIAWVPVLLAGYHRFDFRLYKVDRNDELCAEVERRGVEFMTKYVKPQVAPPNSVASIEVLKRIRRLPGLVVDVEDGLVNAYTDACWLETRAEKIKKAAATALIAALGQAEGGNYSGGMVTYMLTKRKAEAKPRAACEFRTLKVKPAKRLPETIAAGEGAEARYLMEPPFAVSEGV